MLKFYIAAVMSSGHGLGKLHNNIPKTNTKKKKKKYDETRGGGNESQLS